MKRTAWMIILLLATTFAFSQELYQPDILRRLGLTETEVEQTIAIVRDSATDTARLQAELNIKKAELARLLLDEQPAERSIERNLRESADIEVQLRMVEIQRELEIRGVVGTERWTEILRSLRGRLGAAGAAQTQEIADRIARVQAEFRERQQDITRRLRAAGNTELATEVAQQLRQIEQQYREVLELIRQR